MRGCFLGILDDIGDSELGGGLKTKRNNKESKRCVMIFFAFGICGQKFHPVWPLCGLRLVAGSRSGSLPHQHNSQSVDVHGVVLHVFWVWQAHGIRFTLARVWFCRDMVIMPYVICKLCTHICDMHPLLWTPTSTHWYRQSLCCNTVQDWTIYFDMCASSSFNHKNMISPPQYFLHNIIHIYIIHIDIHPIYICFLP